MREAKRNQEPALVGAEADAIRGKMAQIEKDHATLPAKEAELAQAKEDFETVMSLPNQDEQFVIIALAHFSGEQKRITAEIKKIQTEYDNGLADWRTEVSELKSKALEKLKQDITKYGELFVAGKYLELGDNLKYLSKQREELLKHGEKDEYTDQLEKNIQVLTKLTKDSLANLVVGSRFGENKLTGVANERQKNLEINYVDPDVELRADKSGKVEVSNVLTQKDFLNLRDKCSPQWKQVFDDIPLQWEKNSLLKQQLAEAETSGDAATTDKIQLELQAGEVQLKRLVREVVQLATVAEAYNLDKSGNVNDKKLARVLLNFFHSHNLETDRWAGDFANVVRAEFSNYGEGLKKETQGSADVLREKLVLPPGAANEVSAELSAKLSKGGVEAQDPETLLKDLEQLDTELTRLSQVKSILGGEVTKLAAKGTEAEKLSQEAGGWFKGDKKEAFRVFVTKAITELKGIVPGNEKDYLETFSSLKDAKIQELEARLVNIGVAETHLKGVNSIIRAGLNNPEYKKNHQSAGDLKSYNAFAKKIE